MVLTNIFFFKTKKYIIKYLDTSSIVAAKKKALINGVGSKIRCNVDWNTSAISAIATPTAIERYKTLYCFEAYFSLMKIKYIQTKIANTEPINKDI